MVAEYTGLNIREIGEMDLDEYMYYFRDAFIHSMNQTEDGAEIFRKRLLLQANKAGSGASAGEIRQKEIEKGRERGE